MILREKKMPKNNFVSHLGGVVTVTIYDFFYFFYKYQYLLFYIKLRFKNYNKKITMDSNLRQTLGQIHSFQRLYSRLEPP
jgi:hypothetical protein